MKRVAAVVIAVLFCAGFVVFGTYARPQTAGAPKTAQDPQWFQLMKQARAAYDRGHLDVAERSYLLALKRATTIPERRAIAISHKNLIKVYLDRAAFEKAINQGNAGLRHLISSISRLIRTGFST